MDSIIQSALFFAFFLVLASSVLLSALFKFKSVIQYLLCIYLFSFANILLVGELAGLFNLLDSRLFFLLVHILILTISAVLWKKKGTPPLFSPIKNVILQIRSYTLKNYIKNHPTLSLFGIAVSLCYLLAMILVVVVPPNNYDSMTCHMARIGYWLQNGNFLPWPTWFTLQVDYPINAQIEVLWSILFWRTDAFAGFVEWFAAVFSIIAVFGIARLLNRSKSQALFACLIFALFPQILLQATSTMPHLLGSALVLISFYFFFLAIKQNRMLLLALSGLAIGMAIGVHLIVIISLPGYAIIIFIEIIRNRKKNPRILQWFITSSLISFILFSSLLYVQNLVLWGQPFGRNAAENPWALQTSDDIKEKNSYWQPKNLFKFTFYNLSKYVFASYDLTGVPDTIVEPFYEIRDYIAIPFFEKTGNPLHLGEFNIDARVPAVSENWAWFGIISFVLFYPLMIFTIIQSIRKRDNISIALVFSIFCYTLIWAAFLAREDGWSMYSGRYFVPTALFFAPLIAVVYQKRWWSKILCAFLIIVSCVIAYQTMLRNYAKPLIDQPSLFTWNRADKIYSVSREQQEIYRAVDANITRGNLGLLLTPSLIEYPFFGEFFHRTLIPIFPYEKMHDNAWLEDQEINWILSCVDSAGTPDNFEIVSSVNLEPPIGISNRCVLFKRK